MSDGGKGSKARPLSVSQVDYAARWDAIFGRDQAPEPQPVMTDRELMQQALEALTVLGMNYAISAKHWPQADAVITALRERLARP